MSDLDDEPRARPLRVAGEAAGSANPFVSLAERLVVGDAPVSIDLTDLRITDEYAVTQCVNATRELLVRGAHVVLTGAPPSLVEGLARAGLLLCPSAIALVQRVS